MHEWLNDPGVVEWWEGDDVSWPAVRRDYGPDRDEQYVEHWLALDDGAPMGWIQCYAIADEPEERDEWWALGADRTAAGIDYLLGDPGARGKGRGSAMIAAFVDQVVFGLHPEWTQVGASPFDANRASCRALEKAGFSTLGVIDDDEGPCRLLVRGRTSPSPNDDPPVAQSSS